MKPASAAYDVATSHHDEDRDLEEGHDADPRGFMPPRGDGATIAAQAARSNAHATPRTMKAAVRAAQAGGTTSKHATPCSRGGNAECGSAALLEPSADECQRRHIGAGRAEADAQAIDDVADP